MSKANEALDKMAENARELGLDYEPLAGTQVSKVWWDGEKLMAKPIPLKDFYEPAQQEPVAFLASGTRFKISYDNRQSGGQIHGIPPELGGRWVAFVAADDDCHLKLTSPPAQRTWVGLTDEELSKFDVDPVEAKLMIAKLKEKNT